jgi:hypothetical protein
MNLDDIRNRAQGVVEGEVTPEEVEAARQVLRERTGDVAGALYIVGHCGSEADAGLLESYLTGPERDVLGEIAFKALCRYLRLIDRYRAQVRTLIMSSTDFGWANSRMTAIHLAPDYLENASDDEVGCRLVEIYCNPYDYCSASARDSLVTILGLGDTLRDPFGLRLDSDDPNQSDPDRSYIVGIARHRFNCDARLQ